MKRLVLFCSIFLFFSAVIFTFADEIFAPFVSRLLAVPNGNTIKLTWIDSDDSIKVYSVYRGTKKFNNTTFSSAEKIGVVPAGKEVYIDTPPKKADYFYAVLAEHSGNKPYKLFIPFRNITDKPVRITSTASSEEEAAVITGIKTSVLDKEIKISFKSSRPDRKIVVYRSTSPIQEKEDISNASLIATINSGSEVFFDTPVPGISYYYALFDALLSQKDKFVFKIGENITKNSTELPLAAVSLPQEASTVVLRNQPLPFLNLRIGIESGKPLASSLLTFPQYKVLNKKTRKTVSSVSKTLPEYTLPAPSPYIFPVDRSAKENSENYQLVRILSTDFAHKNWKEAKKLLGNFLSLRHSKNIIMRTHFYMGQVLYFMKNYNDSFLEFTLVENHFYRETRPWLNSLFLLMN